MLDRQPAANQCRGGGVHHFCPLQSEYRTSSCPSTAYLGIAKGVVFAGAEPGRPRGVPPRPVAASEESNHEDENREGPERHGDAEVE